MKKQLFLIIVVALGVNIWAKSDVRMQQVQGGYLVEFSLPAWTVGSVNELGQRVGADYRGTVYCGLDVPAFEGFFTEEVGKPELALMRYMMVIADKDKKPLFEVTDVVEQSVVLENQLIPAQLPWPKCLPIEERPFSLDKNYYSSPGLESPFVQIVDVYEIRGVPCATVHIMPFSYNPSSRTLRVVTKARVFVKTEINKHGPLDSKSFEEMINSLTINYYDYYSPNPLTKKDNYLIITADKFEAALAEFKTFRESKFNVSLVKYSVAGGSNTAAMEYIKKQYDNAETKPTFALIVGTHTDIPGFGSSPLTDRPFSSLSASATAPKVHVGRLAVTSNAELANVVKKTIFMEKGLDGKTIPQYAVFIGGVDAGNGQIAEGTHNYCINTYLTPLKWDCRKLYYNSDKTITKADWTAAANKGPVYMYYSAHGGVTSWSVGGSCGSISITDFKALTNTAGYPHSGAFACNTGNYKSTCVSASAINIEKGPVTCIASSVTSTWGPDDKFQRKMFDAMYKDKVSQIGAVFNAGAVGSGSAAYMKQYNLFGDPGCSSVFGLGTSIELDNLAINKSITINSVRNNLISFSLAAPGAYNIALYSISGKKLFNLSQTYPRAGTYTIPYAHKNFAKGLYVVTLQNGLQKVVKKITRE